MQYLLIIPCAEVWAEKKWGVVFPDDGIAKAMMETHLAKVTENQPDGGSLC